MTPSHELITRKTELSGNIVAFCRFLRQQGFRIGPAEEADALLALEIMAPFDDPEAFQLTLRTTLCRSISQQVQFDELYQQYWRELEKAVDSKVVDDEQPNEQSKSQNNQQQPSLQALKSWLYGNHQPEEEQELASYSPGAAMGKKDFSAFTEDELAEVIRIVQILARSLALKPSRRKEKSKRSGQLDLRRTLRQNMRRGGEIMELAFSKPKQHRQKIVLICDVSRSMDLYSRFLIQFMYAFQNAFRRIETFVFSTKLFRVTHQLLQRDFKTALDRLSEEIPGWSGGTRIGESLETFCQDYARRLLNKQTIVLIMSDGWDTGDTELLSDSMKLIQKKAAKVIWLNPLAGSPAYEPTVKGMQAAMPYIDVFAAAHNVESLRRVVRAL